MTDSILSVRNLRVVIPHRHGKLVAIDNISFHIQRGEIIGFVGESGAGKSMTGAAIIGLIDPPGYIERGEIWLDNLRIDQSVRGDATLIRGKQPSSSKGHGWQRLPRPAPACTAVAYERRWKHAQNVQHQQHVYGVHGRLQLIAGRLWPRCTRRHTC